ncbi:Hypothetical predicted protein [Lecanosticta acicola]|uniref:Prion-inhibition and propagation HeLo domain-containing protein n=1 Tax=Lecanosticta acicola TaxID=111012 RepID=A0AAI9EAG0_9PEZI|nr:Hypothetical predicted protein [Lecanosticta acicola]
MAHDKDTSAAHIEHPEHEAVLTGAVALASLFSSCVEAFGLIHPSHRWDKEEQLLLTRLGLEQARLLIWGSALGISAPPASVTNRAVPRHPSSAYPDVKEPTFFDIRDPRLDDPNMRTMIEQTLSDIVDRSASATREEMMAKYGLKRPKSPTMIFEPAMDPNRLESFRERWALLREVAESYAQINTRRNNSIIHSSWVIADVTKFGAFVKLIQEKIDFLINLMNVKDKVDRGMRMDIRMFGWHIAPDRVKTAQDIAKLRLLQEICKQGYSDYVTATQQALDHIGRETRENGISSAQQRQTQALLSPPADEVSNGQHHKKRPALMKLFRPFAKSKDHGRSQSLSAPTADDGPARSQSHPGLTTDTSDDGESLGQVRSKSVGAWIQPNIDESLDQQLGKLNTTEDDMKPTQHTPDSPLQETTGTAKHHPTPMGVPGSIARHDQYRGIARTPTRNLFQDGGNFADK